MTGLTPRLRWARAIKSAAFPAHLRSIKGTLLCLVDVMTSTGELHRLRDDLAEAAGIPARTLDRHLARAVEAGWLVHQDHGGRGRLSRYLAVVPSDGASEVARYSASGTGNSAPLTRGLSLGNSAPPSGALNKKSANDSERVAVDNHRDRRTDHDDGRAESNHKVTSRAGIEEWLPTPFAARLPEAQGDGA